MQTRPPFPTVRASVVLLTLGALSAACSIETSSGESAVEASAIQERDAPPVRACTVEAREMVRVLEATSKLQSEREVPLFPELAGTAVEILVEEGDEVRQGQVLARLDQRDEVLAERDADVALQEAKDNLIVAELAVEEATDQLENASREARQAERDYDRDERLFEASDLVNPLSQQQLEAKRLERDQAVHAEELARIQLRRRGLERDAAVTAIERAEVALERATLTRRRKSIVAPFDGVISTRNIRIGASVGTAEAAFVLTDTRNLRAEFSRPQEELGLFSQGRGEASSAQNAYGGMLSISATAEAYPGQEYLGWVERISPTLDADSSQFRVIARLRHGEGTTKETAARTALLPGMLVRMEIVTERHDEALAIPKRALRREGERRYVLRIVGSGDDARVEEVDVDEGLEDEDFLEVLTRDGATLAAGDRLVLIGSRDLREGDPVRVDGDVPAPVETLPVTASTETEEATSPENE